MVLTFYLECHHCLKGRKYACKCVSVEYRDARVCFYNVTEFRKQVSYAQSCVEEKNPVFVAYTQCEFCKNTPSVPRGYSINILLDLGTEKQHTTVISSYGFQKKKTFSTNFQSILYVFKSF